MVFTVAKRCTDGILEGSVLVLASMVRVEIEPGRRKPGVAAATRRYEPIPKSQNIETAIQSRNQWIASDIESRNFDRSDERIWSIALLSVTTFWTLLREFSPLGVCAYRKLYPAQFAVISSNFNLL